MKQAHAPKVAWVFAAFALLGLLALAGCTLIGDNVTGVKTGVGPTSCVKTCNDLYKTLYEQEQKLHQTNVEACQAQAQPAKGACLTAEDARHTARMSELGDAKIECQNNCHRQGAGSAG